MLKLLSYSFRGLVCGGLPQTGVRGVSASVFSYLELTLEDIVLNDSTLV